MRDVRTIAEHSVDLSLIHRQSKVLDLGCRNFSFANDILDYVDEVYCVDPDQSVNSNYEKVVVLNVAVTAESGYKDYVKFGNGTGNYIRDTEVVGRGDSMQKVQCMTLDAISNLFHVKKWDLIKMDIEGSEYEVLMNLTQAPARQISVEFHQHTAKKKSAEYLQKLMMHLNQWYDIYNFNLTEAHGCGLNYWDVLLIEKE